MAELAHRNWRRLVRRGVLGERGEWMGFALGNPINRKYEI